VNSTLLDIGIGTGGSPVGGIVALKSCVVSSIGCLRCVGSTGTPNDIDKGLAEGSPN